MQNWPHSPPHKMIEPGMYMVTAGTYGKTRYFSDPERLNVLTSKLMEYATRYDWSLQAWAVLSNHYHFIGFASDPANKKLFPNYSPPGGSPGVIQRRNVGRRNGEIPKDFYC